MNIHVTDTGLEIVGPNEHDFARLELRARADYLRQRIRIASVKQAHGLLTAEEQDALIYAAARLKADLEIWKAYR